MTGTDDVIVVGAGTIGLATALGLAQAGINVRVFEASTEVVSGGRDMVYHWPVLPGLRDLGVLTAMEKVGARSDGATFRVVRTGETIEFPFSLIADSTGVPFRLHVTQERMSAILLDRLASYSNVSVDFGHTVSAVMQDEAGVTVLVETGEETLACRAHWVIGADGARSIVRHQLGLALAGFTWPQRMVSTDIRFDLSDLGFQTASTQIDPILGSAVARVGDTGTWRYIRAEHRTLPEESIELRAEATLRQVLPADADPDIDRSYAFRIHERCVERFRVGRVLLVGDSAHLTNSARALGMSSGLCDAFTLVEAMSAVIMDRADAALLDRYSEVRRSNFLDYTSRESSTSMRFIFPFGPWTDQTEELNRVRLLAADPSTARRFQLKLGRLRSPSLLSRKTAVEQFDDY